MTHVKLILEYDGTDFAGWQYQPNGRSVQEEIEKAIRQITQEAVRIAGAGRTDAGVHALGQVASFALAKDVDLKSFGKSLNAVLPEDVVVVDALPTAMDFHARYSATKRRYKYYIMKKPTAVWRRYCWWLNYALDFEAMAACARMIEGEHDFASFCKTDSGVEHHRCKIHESVWRLKGDTLEFDITANRFLYGMVRALVGTMVEVGRGYRPQSEFEKILNERDRSKAGMAAPPLGLFLREVLYEL
ncbi:MAG: tRNA pseudouridine(38-40) synthase TruA [Bacteroidota bacterium]